MTPTMTRAQQLAALTAIRVHQNIIRESLSGNPSPEWIQRKVLHMKRKRSLASAALELVAVLLVTIIAFALGMKGAQAERGYNAIGGEFVFLLVPIMYYAGKRIILDWAADSREKWRATNG